jgi:Bacterial protein of unknown function (DUF922)
MAFQVSADPRKLPRWMMMPATQIEDNQLSHTDIAFDIPQAAHINDRRRFVLDDGWLVIHPISTYLQGTQVSDDLLDHEQGHYDIGLLVARALAPELAALSALTAIELKHKIVAVRDKHKIYRMEAIHKRYDRETKHGTDGIAQTLWNGVIRITLAIPSPTSIMGLPL